MATMDRITRSAELHTILACKPHHTCVAQVLDVVLDSSSPLEAWPEITNGATAPPPLDESLATVNSWDQSLDFSWTTIFDPEYPDRLRSVHDAPPFLFFRGDISKLGHGGVSVVGSRNASPEGLAWAQEISQFLVSQGIPVISGLSRGIDQAAHEAAIHAAGETIGVMSTSIVGPRSPAETRQLHEAVSQSGILISQFYPESQPQKGNCLQRNATMSAIGICTIIVDAGETSSTRTQVRSALNHGRPVILTDKVVEHASWGKHLVSQQLSSVHVVSTTDELAAVLAPIRHFNQPGAVDRMLREAAE